MANSTMPELDPTEELNAGLREEYRAALGGGMPAAPMAQSTGSGPENRPSAAPDGAMEGAAPNGAAEGKPGPSAAPDGAMEGKPGLRKALKAQRLRAAFLNDPLDFAETWQERLRYAKAVMTTETPVHYARKLALSAWYADLRGEDMLTVYDNLDRTIELAEGKKMDIDAAYKAVGQRIRDRDQQAKTYLDRLGGALVAGEGEVAKSVFNVGALLTGMFAADFIVQQKTDPNAAYHEEAQRIDSHEFGLKRGAEVRGVYNEHYEPIAEWARGNMQLPDDWVTSSDGIGDWFGNAGIAVVNYLPQLAAQTGLMAATGGVASLGFVFGTNAYYDIKDETPDISEGKAVLYGVGVGLVNSMLEKVTLGIIEGKVSEKVAREGIKKGFLKMAGHFGWNAGKEGGEEVGEQFAENALDIVFGRRGDRSKWTGADWRRELFRGVPEAFFLGFATGGPLAYDSYKSGRMLAAEREVLRGRIETCAAELRAKPALSAQEDLLLAELETITDADETVDLQRAAAMIDFRRVLDRLRERGELPSDAPDGAMEGKPDTEDGIEQGDAEDDERQRREGREAFELRHRHLPHDPRDTAGRVAEAAGNFGVRIDAVTEWTPEQRRIIRERGQDPDRVQAMWTPDGIVVNAARVRPSEVDAVLVHEVLGHEGLRRAFGRHADSLFDLVWEDRKDSDEMRKIVDKYGPSAAPDGAMEGKPGPSAAPDGAMEGKPGGDTGEPRSSADAGRSDGQGGPRERTSVRDRVTPPRDASDVPQSKRREYAEEFLAHLQEIAELSPDRRPGWFRQFMARVRLWFRQHGIFVHRLSDRDLAAILARAARAGRRSTFNVQRSTSDGGDARFAVAGEQAAARMEDAQVRLADLHIARRMEEDGRDPRDIKRVTGWEKGGDGKWRFELPDVHFSPDATLPDGTQYARDLFDIWYSTSGQLGDYVHAPEIFEAYPELKNVGLDLSGGPSASRGSYDRERKAIWINVNNIPEFERAADAHATMNDDEASPEEKKLAREQYAFQMELLLDRIDQTLIHEVQHAIQHIEGFAPGGNPGSIPDNVLYPDLDEKRRDEITRKLHKLNMQAERNAEREHTIVGRGWTSNPESLKVYDEIKALEQERDAMYARRIAPFDAYLRLAGEVEARNATTRSGMTEEEKRESMLADTADVAPEDMIYLREAVEGESMAAEEAAYNLENARPSKEGYVVERVNENAGRMLNDAKGVVCEKINQVFDPAEAPDHGFASWITKRLQAWEKEHPLKGAYPTPALNGEVKIAASSIRSMGNHGGPDTKYNLIPVIAELLQNAVLVQTEAVRRKDKTSSRSHLLATKVRYGQDERYVAVMVIHESGGKYYYDHSLLVLKEGELGKKEEADTEKRNPATAGSYSPSAQVLNVAGNALLSSGFDAKSEKNVRFRIAPVWTGSAADYDAPSLHYVGTGEGAQVYGWGLYGTSSEKVARWYAENDADRKNKPQVLFNGKPYQELSHTDLAYTALQWVFEEHGVDDAMSAIMRHMDSYKPRFKDSASIEQVRENDNRLIEFLEANRDKIEYVPSFEPEAVYINGRMIEYNSSPDTEEKRILQDIRRAVGSVNGDVERVIRAFRENAYDSAKKAEELKRVFGREDEAEFSLEEQKYWTRAADFLEANKDHVEYRVNEHPKNRNLYNQTFWPDKQENLLDWDKPVPYETIDHVKDAMRREGLPEQEISRIFSGVGELLYKQLCRAFGSPKAASEFLYRAGIDGITYVGDSSGIRNYVAFSDRDIRVDEHVRYRLAEWSEDDKRDIMKMLRPFVRKNRMALDGQKAAEYLKTQGVDIAPEDAMTFARLELSEIAGDAAKKQWRDAYTYYRSVSPIFDFAMNFAGENFMIRPSDGFLGEDFSGSWISPAWVKYSRKRPQGAKESRASYRRYLEKREAALKNAPGMTSDELARAYARETGIDEKDAEQQIVDLFRDLRKGDIRSEYSQYKKENFTRDRMEQAAALQALADEETARVQDEVAEILAAGRPVVDEVWAKENNPVFRELYTALFHKDAPRVPGRADMEAMNAALSQSAGDASLYAEAYKAARKTAGEEAMRKIREFREKIREGRADAMKLQKQANDFLRDHLPAELRARYTSRIIDLMKIEDADKRLAAFDELCRDAVEQKNLHTKKQLAVKLRDRLDRLGRRTDTGLKAVGVRDEETQVVFDEIRRLAELPAPAVADEIESVQIAIEKALENGDPTSELEGQMILLETFGDLFRKDAAGMESAWKEIARLARDGRQLFFDRIHRRAAADAAEALEIAGLVSGGKTLDEPARQSLENRRLRRSALAKAFKTGFFGDLNLWGIFDAINLATGGNMRDNALYRVAQLTHAVGRDCDTMNRQNGDEFNAAFDRIFRITGGARTRGLARAEILTKLREVTATTGVFRVWPDPNAERFQYETLPLEDAKQMLDAFDAGRPVALTGYEAEAIRHQIMMLDRRITLTHRDFDDGVTDRLVEAARREARVNGENVIRQVVIPHPVFDSKPVEMELSPMQALYLRLMWNQPSIRYKMAFNGYSEETMAQIDKFLSPEAKQLGDWMVATLKADHAKIDEVYRELYFTAFPSEENYFPAYYGVRKNSMTGQEVDLGKQGEGARPLAYSPGALKLRVFHLTEPKICDALTLFQNHRMQMTHFVTHGAAARRIRAVFLNKELRQAVVDAHGEEVYKALVEQLRTFVNGGNINAEANALYQHFYSAAVRAKMSLNLTSGLKQTLGVVTFVQEIPPHALAEGLAYAYTHPREVMDTLWHTDYIQNRWQSGANRELRMLLDASGRTSSRMHELMRQWDTLASLPLRCGDMGASLFGGYAVYRYHLRKMLDRGMDETAAKSAALLEMEMAIERTQQSSQVHMLTAAQKGAWRIFATFKSNQILLWNRIAPRLYKGDLKGAAPGALALVLSAAAMTAVDQMIRHGRDFDDWEWSDFLWGVLDDLLAGSGATGVVFGHGLETLRGAYRSGSPADLLSGDIGNALRFGTRLPRDFRDRDLPKVVRDASAVLTAAGYLYQPISAPGAVAREAAKWLRMLMPKRKAARKFRL